MRIDAILATRTTEQYNFLREYPATANDPVHKIEPQVLKTALIEHRNVMHSQFVRFNVQSLLANAEMVMKSSGDIGDKIKMSRERYTGLYADLAQSLASAAAMGVQKNIVGIG